MYGERLTCTSVMYSTGMPMNLIQRIDALLPQTQCGKCGHPGCKPYAEGIAAGEAINKCPPGGQETIAGLAQLLRVPVLELDTRRGEAPAVVAYIREAECIGCTKCIQACPVDAIVGAAKLMHTVIVDECTGCDLCVAPCPVDCIEMRPAANVLPIVGGMAANDHERHERGLKRDRARRRYEQRNARLQREEAHKLAERLARAKRSTPVAPVQANTAQAARDAAVKKAKISVAMSRAQLHKSLKAFGHPPTFEQQSQLIVLQQQFEAAEQALDALEVNSPPPASTTTSKDPELKRAKIQLAYARANVGKLQRQPGVSADELQAAQRTLEDAQRQVDAHLSA
ncbi:electron transport complex subunit RsxB [Pseudomonas sp. MAFF 212408]|uniref:Electron transport complex subunit RsxB n=2 Tax=Pseudomonas kitaguniensis TaxID=2607908 RepID=A0A5N7KJP8_9PSED|nr:electron transport complex subunit RsxB [Pseudomonas kitaguniensis]MPR02433.1 electron transport complex subunit RsxB [Pseudomonas kitaguniensis]